MKRSLAANHAQVGPVAHALQTHDQIMYGQRGCRYRNRLVGVSGPAPILSGWTCGNRGASNSGYGRFSLAIGILVLSDRRFAAGSDVRGSVRTSVHHAQIGHLSQGETTAELVGKAAICEGRCAGMLRLHWQLQSPACQNEDPGRRLMRRHRLDRCPAKSLTFGCQRCGSQATVTLAELMDTFGRDRNVRTIGRHILGCKDKRAHREGENCPITYQA